MSTPISAMITCAAVRPTPVISSNRSAAMNWREARNSLHPMANEEFDEVFDAYFADSDLWVTILTGAGEQAFSAGNDLVYSASGKPMWVPENGLPI